MRQMSRLSLMVLSMVFLKELLPSLPQYKVKILNTDGSVIAESSVFMATPNIDGNTSADISSAQAAEITFTISEAGNYIIRFEDVTNAGGLHEFLLLDCIVTPTTTPNAIHLVNADGTESTIIYSIGGDKRQSMQQGLNIIRTPDGKTKKMIIK